LRKRLPKVGVIKNPSKELNTPGDSSTQVVSSKGLVEECFQRAKAKETYERGKLMEYPFSQTLGELECPEIPGHLWWTAGQGLFFRDFLDYFDVKHGGGKSNIKRFRTQKATFQDSFRWVDSLRDALEEEGEASKVYFIVRGGLNLYRDVKEFRIPSTARGKKIKMTPEEKEVSLLFRFITLIGKGAVDHLVVRAYRSQEELGTAILEVVGTSLTEEQMIDIGLFSTLSESTLGMRTVSMHELDFPFLRISEVMVPIHVRAAELTGVHPVPVVEEERRLMEIIEREEDEGKETMDYRSDIDWEERSEGSPSQKREEGLIHGVNKDKDPRDNELEEEEDGGDSGDEESDYRSSRKRSRNTETEEGSAMGGPL
jgi:hypothetical protein